MLSFCARQSFILPSLFLGLTACSHIGKSVVEPQSPQTRARLSCPAGEYVATHGRCVPERWTCSPLYYASGDADGCDCDCGVVDPDCGGTPGAFWVNGSGLPQRVDACPSPVN